MAKHTPNELDAQAVHVKALSRELSAHSAEYIVRACGIHEDLLAALVMAKSLINANTLLDAGDPANIKIEAAIKQAGSKL